MPMACGILVASGLLILYHPNAFLFPPAELCFCQVTVFVLKCNLHNLINYKKRVVISMKIKVTAWER